MIPIFIVFFLSYGLSLINPGIYWDDWVTAYNQTPATMNEIGHQYGSLISAYIHVILLGVFDNILLYRILLIVVYILSALFLNQFLSRIRELGKNSRLSIVLLFSIFPANDARIALVLFPYALSNMSFFGGLWLVTLYLKTKNIIIRILSLAAFFFSFITNSFLVFYIINIGYLIYVNRSLKQPLLKNLLKLYRYADYLLLPLVFWFLKIKYFMPNGEYDGYNSVTINGFMRGLFDSLNIFWTTAEIFRSLIFNANLFIIIPGILLLFGFLMKKKVAIFKPEKYRLKFFALGIILLYLSVLPYYTVGLVPATNFWDNRHLLLIPLGAALIIYFGLDLIIEKTGFGLKVKYLIYSMIVVLFVNHNIYNNYSLYKDWYKQASLMDNMKSNDYFRTNTTFLIDDKTRNLNAKGRHYAFYEFTGMLKYIYKDEKHLAMNAVEYDRIKTVYAYRHSFIPMYNLKDYVPVEPAVIVTITNGKYPLNWQNFLKLTYEQYFDKAEYSKHLRDVISLQISNIKK